ncbi:MAG: IS4 family transposase [Clostridia bacterium]|nr:IS4 family transposase [Clostridia bacterium]
MGNTGRFAVKLDQGYENVIQNIVANRTDYVKNPNDFTRNRCFTMDYTIKSILGFEGKSLNKELLDLGNPATASAFIQQRDKLKTSVFEDILHQTASLIPITDLYNGYRLLAIDGSDINTPYKEDSDFYIASTQTKLDGDLARGYNAAHYNAFYDVLNRTYLDCRIGPKKSLSEQKAAVQMIESYAGQKAIVLFDRGYPSYNLIEHIIRKPNLDCVIRVPTKLFKKINELPMEDLDVDVSTRITSVSSVYTIGEADVCVSAESPYGKEKKVVTWDFGRRNHTQTVRVVRFKLDSGEYETLVTTLMDRKAFPTEVFKELYHLRWGIETSFRELKYDLGVVNFHTKKDEYVVQEILAKVIMYNYTMAIAQSIALPMMKERKLSYAVNRTMAVSICLRFFRKRGNIDSKNIEYTIQQYLSPIRPGRQDKRKLTPKQYVPFVYRVAA